MLSEGSDLSQPRRALLYARTSSSPQSPDSLDKQVQRVQGRMHALGYDWTVIKVYCNNAVGGPLNELAAFRQMLQELRAGVIVADVILVETLERLGRLADLQAILKELFVEYGIRVLTRDSDFADSDTP